MKDQVLKKNQKSEQDSKNENEDEEKQCVGPTDEPEPGPSGITTT